MLSHDDLLLMAGISRVRFVAAGFTLYTLGYLWALASGYRPDPVLFLAGYSFTALAHLSVHYSNEYFDRHGDSAGSPTPVSGGTGILVLHPALAGKARGIAIFLMVMSWTGSVAYTVLFSYPFWLPLFVLAGILTGWWYSAPPIRLSASGLGEPATMLAIALFLPGAGYIAAARGLDAGFLPLCVPLLFPGLFFILSAELPDREQDRLAGKRNFVARHGRNAARRIILVSSAGAVCAFGLAGAGYPPIRPMMFPVVLLALVFPVMAVRGLLAGSASRSAVIGEATRNVMSLVLFITGADLTFLAGLVLR